jgi:hypothetical protein
MVRIVCDDIRKHSTLPGRKNLSKIASTIVDKHKESFCDVVGDKVIGSGYESLCKQMEERLFNLNRKGKKTSSFGEKLNEVDGTSKPPAKKTRKSVKDCMVALIGNLIHILRMKIKRHKRRNRSG